MNPAPETVHLEILGALHDGPDTILLLGPSEPGFWAAFSAAPEYADGAPDPMDRWSKRVLGRLARDWGGTAIFPSDGPPYPPYLAWALASGRAWQSPVGMLVHDRAGLMISFRGAVRLPGLHPLPAPAVTGKPCESCADRPCLTACPVSALGPNGYDVPVCKAFLHTAPGGDCMTRGCAVRRSCPAGHSYGRLEAQSAFHMRAFR